MYFSFTCYPVHNRNNKNKKGVNNMKKYVYLFLTILYVLSPVDIVPDAIPVAGQADDLLVILWQAARMYKEMKG